MSYIQNKRSNEKIWLRQENGVHVLDLKVGLPVLVRQYSSHKSEAVL